MNRQIFPHSTIRWWSLRWELLPYHWEYLQQDYQVQESRLRNWDCWYRWTGTSLFYVDLMNMQLTFMCLGWIQHLELQALHWNPRLHARLLRRLSTVLRNGSSHPRQNPQPPRKSSHQPFTYTQLMCTRVLNGSLSASWATRAISVPTSAKSPSRRARPWLRSFNAVSRRQARGSTRMSVRLLSCWLARSRSRRTLMSLLVEAPSASSCKNLCSCVL